MRELVGCRQGETTVDVCIGCLAGLRKKNIVNGQSDGEESVKKEHGSEC